MSENPFDRLTRGSDHRERLEARADAAFEAGKVLYVLKAFRLNARKAAAALLARERRERGGHAATFRAFNDAYPEFPLVLGATRLGAVKLHADARAMIPALFRDFGRAPFVTAFEAFYEREADAAAASGRLPGLVFPRKGLKNGMVIYAADDPEAVPVGDRETLLAYPGGGAGKKRTGRTWLVVRSFQRLLEALHSGGHGLRLGGDPAAE